MSGMIFNGTLSSSLHIEHAVPLIPLLPARAPNTIEIAGRDGYFDFGGESKKPQIIPVDILTDAAASETELAGWLAGIAEWLSGSGSLVFDRSPTKQWVDAKCFDQIDMEHYPLRRRFTAYFTCQPYPEDTEEIDDATVDSAQDYESPATFFPRITVTLTADTESLIVALVSTGKFVQITDSLHNGDVIVIDMAAGKATVNGENHAVDITSDWFGVPPGEQQINVTADGTYTAVMAYRKRYFYA